MDMDMDLHAKFATARKVHRGRNLWWAKYARCMIDAHEVERLAGSFFCAADTAELKRALRPRQAASQFLRRPRQGFKDLRRLMDFYNISWDDLCAIAASLHPNQFKSTTPTLLSWEKFPLYWLYGRNIGGWVEYLRVVNSVGTPPLNLLQTMHCTFGTHFFKNVRAPYMVCFLASVDPTCPRAGREDWSWVCKAVFTSPFGDDHWDIRDEWINVTFGACSIEDHIPFATCVIHLARAHNEDILDEVCGWTFRPDLEKALRCVSQPPS